jgi:glycosyltransferase involved in cell wall biosynthesis
VKTISKTPDEMPDNATDQPLVTFALFAYNQEEYIREAVEGAFAQTYKPLEIILSDDCSSDRTFEIMQEMTEAYDGSHTILVRKNQSNMGLGGHINEIVKLVRSDWLVVAAGDDISSSNRTEELMSYISSLEPPPDLLHSAVIRISEDGRFLGLEQSRFVETLSSIEKTIETDAYALGATVAWHKKLFDDFEPLPDNLMYEDQVMQMRAQLNGGIGYLDKPLVQHRYGGVTAEYSKLSLSKKKFGISNERWIIAREQQLRDLIYRKCDQNLVQKVKAELRLCRFRRDISRQESFLSRVALTIAFAKKTGKRKEAIKNLTLACFPSFSEAAFNISKKIRELR